MSPIVLPKSQTQPKTKTVSLRLDVTLVARVDAVAKQTGNSRNEVMAQLVKFGLDAHEKPKK